MSTIVNPFTEWPVTCGWTEGRHGIPGGGPAIDYGIPYGTTLRSPCDGTVALSQGGPAGLVVAIVRSDNSQIILCHNSEFLVRHGTHVRAGDQLSRSGNSGTVIPRPTEADPHAGSHLHTYGLHADGRRWDWTLDAAPMPAGGGDNPFPTEPKEWDEMATEKQIRDIVRAEVKKTAAEVWNYDMGGGAKVAGRTVPSETAGERLRQIRRSTFNTGTIIRSIYSHVRALLGRIPEPAPEPTDADNA